MAAFATGVTAPPAPRPRWARRGRLDLVAVADVIVALITFAATNSKLNSPPTLLGHPSGPVVLVISLALCAPLAVRTWVPLTAWVGSVLATFWIALTVPSVVSREGPRLVQDGQPVFLRQVERGGPGAATGLSRMGLMTVTASVPSAAMVAAGTVKVWATRHQVLALHPHLGGQAPVAHDENDRQEVVGDLPGRIQLIANLEKFQFPYRG